MSFDRFARLSRTLASNLKQRFYPSPEVRAWRNACEQAARTPRYTPGTIRLLKYEIDYVDLMTVCPQWNDLFVRQTLKVRLHEDSPLILDCGANVGLATLYFKRLYPRARVTAFEADPQIFSVLERNLHRNGCSDVQVIHGAVWTKNGPVRFRIEGADSGALDDVAGGLVGSVATVPGVRLRDRLAGEKVSLLKLDIEGAEVAVLEDCRDMLGNVHTLLLDLHEFDPQRRGTQRVFELLSEEGFTFSLDELCALPWRKPTASDTSPFPGTHLCWAVLVRAWRE